MKGPESYLKGMGIGARCVVHPSRPAVIDSSLREFIGHDLFYFSDQTSRRRFLKEPLRYCRALSDPVTKVRFKPRVSSPRVEYQGRLFYFATDSTRTAFTAMPDSFAVRRGM